VKSPPSNALLWFGVLGGATAWTVQFLANLFFTFAQCDPPTARWALPVHGWEIGLSVAAVIVGLASLGVSLWIYLRTYQIEDVAAQERRGEGVTPPLGRVNFLSMIGMTVNSLTLVIIIMTGIGAPLLPICQQA
jgi:putative flippase GtrA